MKPETSAPIRVSIVDDQQLFLDGLSSLLGACPELEVVSTAQSGDEALEKFAQDCPQIVLLDLSMPGKDGMEVLEDLKVQFPDIRAIMLPVHDDRPSIQESLSRGAWGYVLKISGKDELLDAVLRVAGGRKAIDEKIWEGFFPMPHPEGFPAGKNNKPYAASGQGILSVREVEVLTLISEGKTSEAIASQLFLSVNTIDTHRKNIISKLGARNITDAVRLALQKGLI